MLARIFFIFFSTVAFDAICQTDTLVYQFAFEERLVTEALNNAQPDFLSLFSAINTDSIKAMQYGNRLNNFYITLDTKVLAAKSNRQKAKVIFKEVHDHFFKQYEEFTSFNNIFESGLYNCVTGSMLYSLVLKKYGIPYEIKEKPTHVYIVAFPESENILFETTNPKGFYMLDEKQKKTYVQGLVALKFTTQEHVNKVGFGNAFNEFYYNSESITQTQLAALQYYNFALAEHESGHSHAAIAHALKTNMLFPSSRHQYLLLEMLGVALNNSNFETLRDIMYVCEFANACRDVNDKRQALDIFKSILEQRLLKNDDEAFTSKTYLICKEKIRDTALVNDISFQYHYTMAYWYTVKGDWNNCLESGREAHKINPRDIRLHEMILRAVIMNIDKIDINKDKAAVAEGYASHFPFLEKNKTYKALLVYSYAQQSYIMFSHNSEAEGYTYMKKAEATMKLSEEKLPMVDQFIGLMYAEAGAYHFRKQQYEKAKQVLLLGLEIVPDHPEIKARLEIVEDKSMRPDKTRWK